MQLFQITLITNENTNTSIARSLWMRCFHTISSVSWSSAYQSIYSYTGSKTKNLIKCRLNNVMNHRSHIWPSYQWCVIENYKLKVLRLSCFDARDMFLIPSVYEYRCENVNAVFCWLLSNHYQYNKNDFLEFFLKFRNYY